MRCHCQSLTCLALTKSVSPYHEKLQYAARPGRSVSIVLALAAKRAEFRWVFAESDSHQESGKMFLETHRQLPSRHSSHSCSTMVVILAAATAAGAAAATSAPTSSPAAVFNHVSLFLMIQVDDLDRCVSEGCPHIRTLRKFMLEVWTAHWNCCKCQGPFCKFPDRALCAQHKQKDCIHWCLHVRMLTQDTIRCRTSHTNSDNARKTK